MQRYQSTAQSWHFMSIFPRKTFVWESDRQDLGCVASLWEMQLLSSLLVQPFLSSEGVDLPATLLQACQDYPKQETFWICPPKSQWPLLAELSSVG